MCGIAGLYAFDRERPIAADQLARMTQALVHRGPDDVGMHVAAGIGLGFRRLAIMDPRPVGNQPHYNRQRTMVSVCNGELYNHAELRRDLTRDGVIWQSSCDAEVLPYLFQRDGDDALLRLNGQFALAVYDAEAHRLVLARDPVGVCPLFWCEVNGQILFASEIKGLLAHSEVPRQVDLTGFDQLLTFPGVVSPRTLFAGIQAVPPGHAVVVEHGQVRVQRYWDLTYPVAESRPPPPDWEEELEHLLLQAVQRRLQADVPLAFYLSGGLDSSLLAGMIRRLCPHDDWQAFSMVFADAALDERRYQREVAEHLGVRLEQLQYRDDMVDARLPAVIRASETPLRETYNVCSHALAEAVQASGYKVVLSGEGADELFAGYVGYRFDALGRDSADGFDAVFDEDAWAETQLRERLWGDGGFFYERDYATFREVRRSLYAPHLAAQFGAFDASRSAVVDTRQLRGRHPLHQRSYVDMKLRVADHLLADHGDRMGFAHSVEGRYPFLDADLIAFVTRLPPALLMHDGREKFPLRQVARRYVPPAVIAREKFSFVAPGSPVLLSRAARGDAEWVADLLDPSRIAREGYFNPEMVARLRAHYVEPGFQLNQTFDADLMMVILSFQLWLESFDMPSSS